MTAVMRCLGQFNQEVFVADMIGVRYDVVYHAFGGIWDFIAFGEQGFGVFFELLHFF